MESPCDTIGYEVKPEDTDKIGRGFNIDNIEGLSQLASIGNDTKGLSLIMDNIHKINTKLTKDTDKFKYYLDEKDSKIINGKILYRIYKNNEKTNSFMSSLDIFTSKYEEEEYGDIKRLFKYSEADINIINKMNFYSCSISKGTFNKGSFFGGKFRGGTYNGGIYFDGIFMGTITIYGGEFHNGSFSSNMIIYDGLFYQGEFTGSDIIIYGGEFHGGEYFSSVIIYDGYFVNCNLYKGIYYNGRFLNGEFHALAFFNGEYDAPLIKGDEASKYGNNKYYNGTLPNKTIFLSNGKYIKITKLEYIKLKISSFFNKDNLNIIKVKTKEVKGIFKRAY